MGWARGPCRGAPDMGRATSSAVSSGGVRVAGRDPRFARGSSRRLPWARALRRRAGPPGAGEEVSAPEDAARPVGSGRPARADRASVGEGVGAVAGGEPPAEVRPPGVAVTAPAEARGADGAARPAVARAPPDASTRRSEFNGTCAGARLARAGARGAGDAGSAVAPASRT